MHVSSSCSHPLIDLKKDTPHVELLNSSPIILAPGQSRPIPLWLSSRLIDVEEGITIGFCYIRPSDRYQAVTASSNLKFKQRSIQSPHRFTFLHPSQSVSYAILRPPSSTASEISFPVLLNLHGAGLEADSQQVRHMLDAVPELNAWVLFPTGMSPWSGDDWHVWGFADVIAAVSAIPDWIKNMNWMGPGVDIEKWVVTGHSNGGQGAWFISTHQPDKVIATVAASGYSSSENYVPYSMWREASPLVGSIVHNSRISYRHELLLANMTGIPIHQQHGAKDDNVPAYHSRLLSSLLHESGCSSQYIELPDRGHWFEGAMTTKSLQDFYSSVLNLGNLKKQIPEAFEFIIPNSGDIGSRVGIIVDQLQLPDIPGRLRVRRDDNIHTWHIETSNIHRMHFQLDYPHVQPPRVVSVDSRSIPMPSPSDGVHPMTLVRHNGTWLICNSLNWKALSGRYGRQRGSLDAILRTPSLFKIKVYSEEAFEAALQVSRNLMQYFGADAEIVVSQTDLKSAAGHIISLGQGNVIPPCLIDDFPLQICEEGIEIRRRQGNVLMRIPNQTGLASVFLRPLPDEKLELILWGCDAIGLQQAVRMVPTLTGVGQPDFIVLGNGARWKGCAGVLAMGFFDHEWQVSQASYIS